MSSKSLTIKISYHCFSQTFRAIFFQVSIEASGMEIQAAVVKYNGSFTFVKFVSTTVSDSNMKQ